MLFMNYDKHTEVFDYFLITVRDILKQCYKRYKKLYASYENHAMINNDFFPEVQENTLNKITYMMFRNT